MLPLSPLPLDGGEVVIPADEGSEPEVHTSKCQRKPTAKAQLSKTATIQVQQNAISKVLTIMLSLVSCCSPTPTPDSGLEVIPHSPTPSPNSGLETIPVSSTTPLVSFKAQKRKNKLAPAVHSSSVTNAQSKNNRLGSVVHPPSTTRMNGGIRDGSDGDDEEEGGNEHQGHPSLPAKDPLAPPVFSPSLCRAFGQKCKQDHISMGVSHSVFSSFFEPNLD
jgi:hypothetical protein